MNRKSHNKGEKFPAEPLSREEVITLMNVCSRRAPTGKRDRALICILWRGQLRVSEALALKVADFDPTACTPARAEGEGQKGLRGRNRPASGGRADRLARMPQFARAKRAPAHLLHAERQAGEYRPGTRDASASG